MGKRHHLHYTRDLSGHEEAAVTLKIPIQIVSMISDA